MHDEPPRGGLAGESDLGDALVLGKRLAGLDAKAVDHVKHTGRQEIADQVHEHHDRHGRLLGRFQHHAIAAGESGRELPHRHEDREVPRDDLTDHAERLVIVIGDRVVIDLRERAFLGADAGREIAEMIDCQRNVGEGRLADRLAVVDGLDRREHLEVLLHAVGDLVENGGARSGRGFAPGILRLMRRVERKLDVGRLRAGDLAHRLAGDRADIVEILAGDRRYPFAADEILVAGPHGHARVQGLDDLVQHEILP